MSRPRIRICFVCTANICRSPTAEAIMKSLVGHEQLADRIEVGSAGTHAMGGALPDPRSSATAAQRGLELTGRSRRFEAADLAEFDYVIAMDRSNRRALLRLAEGREVLGQIALMREFDRDAPPDASVPDPFSGQGGFDHVFEICEVACRGLLEHIVSAHQLSPSAGRDDG
jgi:protein-tyrosine phosphatase